MQIPIIKKAKELQLYVIIVDVNKEALGKYILIDELLNDNLKGLLFN